MNDFSGYDFAAGTVRGLRAFRVDELGRLTGYTYQDPWRPGENVAKCGGHTGRVSDIGWIGQQFLQATASTYFTISPTKTRPSPLSKDGEVTEHDMAKCQCGFYAYFDGSNDYADHEGTVAAVVEGYGKTVLGTRGFRADKVRIVALSLPSPTRRRIPLRVVAAVTGALTGLAGVVGIPASTPLHALSLLAWVASLAIAIVGGLYAIDHFARKQQRDRKDIPSHLLDKVRRNYPDIPVFTSVKAMVRAFPPDQGVVPSPETDPEFWTRAVSR